MSIELLISFSVASFLICLAPGPDNIFVLMLSALHGRKSGLLVTLGLCSGLIVHTLIVALGVASLLQSLPYVFAVISYIGAIYLAYLAWSLFKASADHLAISTNGREKERSDIDTRATPLYLRGFYMNITNPKVSIFFLAFLPQFTEPNHGHLLVQFLVLGLIFIVIAFLVFAFIAFTAGRIGALLNQSPMTQIYLNRVAGIVFVCLAIKLVIFGSGTI